ncbi:MAG: DUF6273 domain-containing protein [Defluviitaleaceae bacterium]|nr:DUF6273 domain-containing protein [Defluviitaleaceae bacterium]
MFNVLNQVLQKIKLDLGTEIFNDNDRLTAALNDMTDNKKVRNLTRIAVCELQAYQRLKKDNHIVSTLAREMSDDYMIPYEITSDVMECIADLIGHDTHFNTLTPRRTKPETSEIYAPDNIVSFGIYDWRVLAVQDNKALLLSENIITSRPYHFEYTDIVWEDCTLRHYLNNDFRNTFSAEEKEHIIDHEIFLLSIEEIEKYKVRSQATTEDGIAAWWWLRSQGDDTDCAAYVNAAGIINTDGISVNLTGGTGSGVRPAMWVTV